MKKVRKKQWLYLIIVARKERRWQLSQSKKISNNKNSKKIKNRRSKFKSIRKTIKKLIINAPEKLTLTDQDNRTNLLKFINRIRRSIINGHRVHLSFDKTNTLSPCGTLFMVANIEYHLALYPGKFSCDYPIDDTVEHLFQHIGLLKLLGNDVERKQITAENVRDWQYVSGTSTDNVSEFKNLIQ